MRLYLIISFVLVSVVSKAQQLRVVDLNREHEKFRKVTNFDFAHPDFDSSKLTWVADLHISFDTVIPGMIGECYKQMKDKANRYGANAFRVKSSDIYTLHDEKYIEVAVYWIRMEDREENLKLQKEKKVYLFGFLGYHEEIDGYDVQVNDEDLVMRSLSYRVYEFEDVDQIEIQLGSSLRGTKEYVRIEKNMDPKFFNFHMVTGSFKNAWIGEYDQSLGLFLTQILERAN